jgi:hypothetical protein
VSRHSSELATVEAIVRIRCAAAFAAVLLVGACSSGPSRQDYGTSVEGLVTTMVDQLIEAGTLTEAQPSIENIQSFVNQRASARRAFVEGFEALQPPPGGEEFHDTALGIMTRIADAETALAEAVAEGGSYDSFDAVWQTPEGQRVLEAEDEVIALCEAAQAAFDNAAEAQLAGSVWVPREMREVVNVAFRCTG